MSSHADRAQRFLCDDCGWVGAEPQEAEHPNNEFPIMLLCPVCAGDVRIVSREALAGDGE